MKCCTLPDGDERKGDEHRKGKDKRGRGSLLGKAAKACKGKKGKAFRKCVKAKIRKMR